LMSVGVSFDGAGNLELKPDAGDNGIFLENYGNGHVTGFLSGTGELGGEAGLFDVSQVFIEEAKGRILTIHYDQLGDQNRPFGLYAFAAARTEFKVDMNGYAVRSDLFLTALGGAGPNTFSVNAAGVNVLGGTFGVYVGGGEGPATISVQYSGVKSKNAKLSI